MHASYLSLLCLMPDDFTYQGESAAHGLLMTSILYNFHDEREGANNNTTRMKTGTGVQIGVGVKAITNL